MHKTVYSLKAQYVALSSWSFTQAYLKLILCLATSFRHVGLHHDREKAHNICTHP